MTEFLLEGSAASQEAERMGLERKPGFGNYGPPGDDTVSHRSRGGELIPVGDTTGPGKGSGLRKATSSGGTTRPRPQRTTPKPPSTSKQPPRPQQTGTPKPPSAAQVNPEKKARAEERWERSMEKGGPRKLADLLDVQPDLPFKVDIAPAFGNTPTRGKDIVLAVGQLMGVPTEDVIVNDTSGGGDAHYEYEEMARAGTPLAEGAFHPKIRSIWMHPKQREAFQDALHTPSSLWTPEMCTAHHIVVHEGIHSTSPRLRPNTLVRTARPGGLFGGLRATHGNPVVLNLDTLSMEEGLTEYMARYMTKHTLQIRGAPTPDIAEDTLQAYDSWVKGVRLLVTYGGLDPMNLFKTASAEELRAEAQRAEDATLSDLLSRELGMGDLELQLFLEEVYRRENREVKASELDYDPWVGEFQRFNHKSLAIMNPRFQNALHNLLRLARTDNFEKLPSDLSIHLLMFL